MAPNQPPMRFMSATLMPMEVTVGVGIWGRRSAETLRVSKHGGLRGGSWERAGSMELVLDLWEWKLGILDNERCSLR